MYLKISEKKYHLEIEIYLNVLLGRNLTSKLNGPPKHGWS